MSTQEEQANYTRALQLYRQTNISVALEDSLTELVESGEISPELKTLVLEKFFQVLGSCLFSKVKDTAVIRASVDKYRQIDQVWQFDLQNVKFWLNKGEPVDIGKLRVVCVEKGDHLKVLDNQEEVAGV